MFSLYCPFTIVYPLRHSSIVLLFRIGSHPAVYKLAIVLQLSLKLDLVCNTNVLEVFASLATYSPQSLLPLQLSSTLLELSFIDTHLQYTLIYVAPSKVLGALTDYVHDSIPSLGFHCACNACIPSLGFCLERNS